MVMLWLMLVEIVEMGSLVKARELHDVMVNAGEGWRDEEPCES